MNNTEIFKFYRLIKENFPKTPLSMSLCDDGFYQFLDQRPFQKKVSFLYWPNAMNGMTINE
jgi:hypothetical protein